MSKRVADIIDVALVADKRFRANLDEFNGADRKGKELVVKPKKHSMKGPTMLLTGHDGEIFTAKFHPNGTTLASAGGDRSIFLWSTRDDCENYAILKSAHSHTIIEIQYSSDGDKLFSCSADKSVIMWDSGTGCRLKKLRNHQSIVNSISSPSGEPHYLASVGDDCLVNIFDLRKRRCVMSFQDKYPLTAVSFDKRNNQVFAGGIENTINVWDMRQGTKSHTLFGHSDTITGLSLSPDGNHLLSNSMDNSLKCWNIMPSTTVMHRLKKTFLGHQHDFTKNLLRCAWSTDQQMVSAGSSDGLVHIWDSNTGDSLYKLPGHRSSVNEVAFSPKESIVLSCSSDKQIYLGEL